MINFKSKYLPLVFIVLAFIVAKIPHLSDPHYWDESWSYATAVQKMYEKGPTLLPGSIDVDATRGHPLLFYAAAASWMKVFGDSLPSKHAFGLFISILLLITVYWVAYKLYNVRVAIIATILFASQIFFFVQSSMLLPEVMVTLFFFTSVYFFVAEKYVALAVSLTLLYLTKESGLVAGIVLGIAFLVSLFSKENSNQEKLKMFLALLFPGLIIVTFYVIQKAQYGWFFFPQHMGLIEAKLNVFLAKFQALLSVIIIDEKRKWLWMMMGALAAFCFIRKQEVKWLLYITPMAIVLFFIKASHFNFLINAIFTIVFILFILLICFQYGRKTSRNDHQNRFIILAALLSIAYLVFCSINFYTVRYLLSPLLFSLLVFAVWLDLIIKNLNFKLYVPIAIIFVALSTQSYLKNNNTSDTGLGTYTALAVQKDIIDYLESIKAQNSQIGVGAFVQRTNLQFAACGFIKNQDETFQHVRWDIDGQTDYALFDNLEPDSRYEAIKNDPNFELVHEVTKENVWAAVYKVKK